MQRLEILKIRIHCDSSLLFSFFGKDILVLKITKISLRQFVAQPVLSKINILYERQCFKTQATNLQKWRFQFPRLKLITDFPSGWLSYETSVTVHCLHELEKKSDCGGDLMFVSFYVPFDLVRHQIRWQNLLLLPQLVMP